MSHLLICRHEIYEGYKGQRQACPDAVKEAVPRLQRLLDAMAIPYIQARAACGCSFHFCLFVDAMAIPYIQVQYAALLALAERLGHNRAAQAACWLRRPSRPSSWGAATCRPLCQQLGSRRMRHPLPLPNAGAVRPGWAQQCIAYLTGSSIPLCWVVCRCQVWRRMM